MSTLVLRIPKAAVSMQTGIIAEWLVEDGAVVTEGQPIYNLEIEKTAAEIDGRLPPCGSRSSLPTS